MAEYILLAAFVTVLSAATVWTVRTLKYVGKACYQAILPSAGTNVKKAEEPVDGERRTLSEALADVRMPWGWEPTGLAQVHDAGANMPEPALAKPTVVPWGWPGNPGRINGHSRGSSPAAGHTDVAQPHAAYFGGLDPEAQDEDDNLLMEIRGSQFGGFHVVKDGQVPVRDARSPWGW